MTRVGVFSAGCLKLCASSEARFEGNSGAFGVATTCSEGRNCGSTKGDDSGSAVSAVNEGIWTAVNIGGSLSWEEVWEELCEIVGVPESTKK